MRKKIIIFALGNLLAEASVIGAFFKERPTMN